ncbi:hypothetical protein EMCRGX_G018652 [Ephydatia muelleri]
MGEDTSPESCFDVSSYPQFLCTMSNEYQVATVPDIPPKSSQPTFVAGAMATTMSSSKKVASTPDLYGNPLVGKAMASSTPVPRSLAFTAGSTEANVSSLGQLPVGGGRVVKEGVATLARIKTQLSYSSSAEGSKVRARHLSPGVGAQSISPHLPRFGVLPTPTASLTFTTTPSPTTLPHDYRIGLMSAPKSCAKSRGKPYGQPASLTVATPEPLSLDSPASSTSTDASLQTHAVIGDTPQMGEVGGAPAVEGSTPRMTTRRSSARGMRPPQDTPVGRAGGGGGVANSRRISELTPSGLTTQSLKAKPRARKEAGQQSVARKLGSKVTFAAPVCGPEPDQSGRHLTDEEGVEKVEEEEVRREVAEQVDFVPVLTDPSQDTVVVSLEEAALESIRALMQLLQAIGTCYKALHSYDLLKAVKLFQSLPTNHFNTPWVMCQVGKAYFAGEKFKEAAKVFEEVHLMDPHRQEGMELYASALWHLQRETDLSTLADRLQSSDKLRPQALCAMASVLNLYKDHQTAIQLLQRSIQACLVIGINELFTLLNPHVGHSHQSNSQLQGPVALVHVKLAAFGVGCLNCVCDSLTHEVHANDIPMSHTTTPQVTDRTVDIPFKQEVDRSFPYAHTLLGYEYCMTKDYEKALTSMQSAVAIDPRHYSAWYGMAYVCCAQEKFKLSEIYASKALAINKCSSIACTQLGLALYRQKKFESALKVLNQAIRINKSNHIPKFHKALVLESLGRPQDALTQLEELTSTWPKEPSLYISKGKLLQKLGRPHDAVLQFSWARDFTRHDGTLPVREDVDQAAQLQPEGAGLGQDDEDFVPHVDGDEEGEEAIEEEGESEDDMDS